MGIVVRQKVKGKGNPWWIFINYNGKRKAKLIGDKRAAEDVASAIREKLKKGEFRIEDNNGPLFKDYAQKWLETDVASACKYSTYQGYEIELRRHILPVLGNKRLSDISKKDIKDLIYAKYKEGLSQNTVRNIKMCLSGVLSSAVDDELIPKNVASKVGKFTKKKDQKEEINPYTVEETALFLEACQRYYPRYYPSFLCGFRTGMRIGELVAIQWPDIDFNSRFIEVRRNYVCGRITTPKSGKTRRVDMTPQLAETLNKLRIERKKEALKRGWKEVPEWVFCNEEGNILDVGNLRKRVFYKCQEKAGLRRVRLHDMRHTYATVRISKGDNIADVSKQLGHSSVQITTDVYYHWMPGKNKAEVDELDNLGATERNLYAIRTHPVGDQSS